MKNMETQNIGKLFLIPAPLGEAEFSTIFPTYNSEAIQDIERFIVEDLRTGRRFIKKLGMKRAIDELEFLPLEDYKKPKEIAKLLDPCLQGKNVGLLSDAGTPCIADPGNVVVAAAQKMKVEVIPLVGPNSIILALMGSGFNGQSFSFNGYLPRDQAGREQQILWHEKLMLKNGQTQIFIETPYRNNHFLKSLLNVCQHDTQICVATDVTTEEQSIITKNVKDWKKTTIDIHKKPTIFLIGKTR